MGGMGEQLGRAYIGSPARQSHRRNEVFKRDA
jgi:hypothetical protein